MSIDLLQKYVEGKCNRAELKRLSAWVREGRANEDFFVTFTEGWDLAKNSSFEEDVQQEWAEFKKRISLIGKSIVSVNSIGNLRLASEQLRKKKYKLRFQSLTVLSTVFCLLFTGLLYLSSSNWLQPPTVKSEEPLFRMIETGRGQRTAIQLNDGTKVVLNSSSFLKIPQNFGIDHRELYLKGEAFFEVVHTEGSPFIVFSNNTYARDIGTKFNVVANDSAGIEVAVAEGIVSLGRVEDGLIQEGLGELTENKLGTLNNEGDLSVSDIDDIEQFTGWVENKLIFKKTPLPVVIERLEEWFDIDCNIEAIEDAEKLTLTAKYHGATLHEILNVLSMTMNMTYIQNGKNITFNQSKKQF